LKKVFFTSDTHFGSRRTLELSKRPFGSTIDMDTAIVRNWNLIVGKQDEVYHLGDFGNYEMASSLNGTINLLLGNYERKDIEDKVITIDALKNKYNFNVIEDSVEKVFNDIEMYLIHEPEKHNKDKFNLFGHIHGRQIIKRYGLDVGIDAHHFYPIDLDTVLFYKTAIEKFYDNNVFE